VKAGAGTNLRRARLRYAAAVALLAATALGPLLPGLRFPLHGQTPPRFRIEEERAREFFRRGLAFYHGHQYVAAREFFYKALDVQPYFHLSRRYLGDSYYFSGEWNAALEQWDFLDEVSGGVYPLVQQRANLLRFRLNRYRNPGEYLFLRSHQAGDWSGQNFRQPTDTAVDAQNRLYILSFGSANILVVDPSGKAERAIQGPIWDRLQGPLAMELHDERLYVADYTGDRIRVFDLHGRALFSFGGTGSADGAFHGPAGIATGGGHVYVSDQGNRRIQKFNLEGKFVASFGGPRDAFDGVEGVLSEPAGLAVRLEDSGRADAMRAAATEGPAEAEILVADPEDGRIVRYDQDGNYLGEIRDAELERPRGVDLSPDGNRLAVADEVRGVSFYSLRDGTWEQLPDLRNQQDEPVRIERAFSANLDGQGGLNIADYGLDRVLRLTPRGFRIANLEMRIQRIDSDRFPGAAVFLFVKDRLGRPIRGLSRRDFELYENDRRILGINATNMQPYDQRANLAIVKENSRYFREHYNVHLEPAMRPLLEPLRISDRLEVVRVGEQVRGVYEGLERLRILEILGGGDLSDEPNLGKGLYEGVTLLADEIGPRAVVLVVSGREFPGAYQQYSLQKIRQYAAANGVMVNVISFEADEESGELRRSYRELAQETGGFYIRGFDESRLRTLYDAIAARKDERYIITYRSLLSKNLAGRYIDVRVAVNYLGAYGLADSGYFTPGER